MKFALPPTGAIGLALLVALSPACSSEEVGGDEPTKVPTQIAEYPSAPFEDRDGNLWFRTAFKGLIRYDGLEFVAFTTDDGLGSNMIRDILEDGDGDLWIATSGGLSKYDGERFTTLVDYSKVSDLGNETLIGPRGTHCDLWEVMEDRSGRLWVTSLDGVFRMDGESFTRHPLPAMEVEHDFEFTPKMVYDVYEDRKGVLWFCTDGAGVIRDDGQTQIAYTVKDGLCSDFVCTVAQDARGDLWFGTSNGGVSHFDGESFTTHLRSEVSSESMGWGRFMGLHLDQAGSMWFGAAGPVRGAYRFDGENFRHYSAKDGLGDGHVASISEDQSGNLWFGTTAGVYRFDGKKFVNFTRNP